MAGWLKADVEARMARIREVLPDAQFETFDYGFGLYASLRYGPIVVVMRSARLGRDLPEINLPAAAAIEALRSHNGKS